jgi:tRNA 5-methylaminomethyl-2-thiouridine biosynthesis bifunctional protein
MNSRVTPATKTAIVIGAGLAGANVAERLASRGWRVDVIDSAHCAGQGASGNPAGIVLPQIARDDALPARFSRACFTYLVDFLKRFPDFHWHASGVIQIARDADHESVQREAIKTSNLPTDFATFLPKIDAEAIVGQKLAHGGWWFPRGGWLAPANFCNALLVRHPDLVHCHFKSGVARIQRTNQNWIAVTDDRRVIAAADHLVLANAYQANSLIDYPLPLKLIRGQISQLDATSLPQLRVVLCRNGYLTPAENGLVSFGASFVNDDRDLTLRSTEHMENLDRLKELLPQFELDQVRANPGALRGRVAHRTVTPDRLPLVGTLPDTNATLPRSPSLSNLPRRENLHALLGLSARGIVWAPLAAEHLACVMNQEPSPIAGELAGAIDAGRFFLKDTIRGQRT